MRRCRSGAAWLSGRGLPMSSTPLPFQWNFTTVPKPLTVGYVIATVSPVVCEGSMPLNP